jgi:hypothetical protein
MAELCRVRVKPSPEAGGAEFLSNSLSDTYFANAQTGIRMIQYMDAGARHGASFNLFDGVRLA